MKTHSQSYNMGRVSRNSSAVRRYKTGMSYIVVNNNLIKEMEFKGISTALLENILST